MDETSPEIQFEMFNNHYKKRHGSVVATISRGKQQEE
tara:strand:- start:1369 stop:1479 length:111 start_codon:yes stop_codon:yes gene_type:complete